MRTRGCFAAAAAVAAMAVMAGHAARAADRKAILMPDEITVANIKPFFDVACLNAEIDKDGDLKIEDDGVRTYIRIDPKHKIITYYSSWEIKASVPEAKKLAFINRLNDKMVLVRYCIAGPTTLWCDYQCLYEGGITPYTIVNTYRQFARIVDVSWAGQDADAILGSDAKPTPSPAPSVSPAPAVSCTVRGAEAKERAGVRAKGDC